MVDDGYEGHRPPGVVHMEWRDHEDRWVLTYGDGRITVTSEIDWAAEPEPEGTFYIHDEVPFYEYEPDPDA